MTLATFVELLALGAFVVVAGCWAAGGGLEAFAWAHRRRGRAGVVDLGRCPECGAGLAIRESRPGDRFMGTSLRLRFTLACLECERAAEGGRRP